MRPLIAPAIEAVPAAGPRSALWRRLMLPAGCTVVAASLAGWVAWTMKPAVSGPVTRFRSRCLQATGSSQSNRLVTSWPYRQMAHASRMAPMAGCTFVCEINSQPSRSRKGSVRSSPQTDSG